MKQTITILLFTCLCTPALAQNYVIEYESPPGFRLALQIEPFETDRLEGESNRELERVNTICRSLVQHLAPDQAHRGLENRQIETDLDAGGVT